MAEHKVFSGAPPWEPTAHNDGDPTIVTTVAFYSTATPLFIVGARARIPALRPDWPGTVTLAVRIAPANTLVDLSTPPAASAVATVADGTIEAASRIDTPLNRATLAGGNVVVAGRAWHQQVPIGGVEVSVDDGPWLQAVLAADMGIDTWRLWQFNWSATVGPHTLRVRMFDRDGRVQSSAVKRPGPGAASGYQSISVYIE